MSLGLYIRLSIADGDLKKGEKDESNSVDNQRELLRGYVEENRELDGDVIEYVDDGYTGTNFNRPAFRRMIEDAKKGRIRTIITKDLSRLGRDYIGVGDYLEQIFPVLGVRFIAVNSNYDSNAYSGMTMGLDMQVDSLVNHLYSRDISKKIKSARKTKWKQGISTSGRLPFGYRKDKKARGGWAIDNDAAKTVRIIFGKAIEGMGTKRIAEYLNDQGLATPGVYRERKGQYYGVRRVPDREALWDTAKVRGVLVKYEYTGAFVHNYRESVQVGSTLTRKVPEHERIITEDAHEAIVTKEEFYAAQDAVRTIKRADYKIPGKYVLRGKVRCGNCRLIMPHIDRAHDGAFYCAHKMKAGKYSSCCGEAVPEKLVESVVYAALRRQLWQMQKLQEHMDGHQRVETGDRGKEYKAFLSQIDLKQAERVRQYVAYAEGVISLEEYLSVKERLSREIEGLRARASKVQAIEMEESELVEESSSFFEKAAQALESEKLTGQMEDEFIEAVYVYDEKHIEVVFTFEDLLKKLTKKVEGDGGQLSGEEN